MRILHMYETNPFLIQGWLNLPVWDVQTEDQLQRNFSEGFNKANKSLSYKEEGVEVYMVNTERQPVTKEKFIIGNCVKCLNHER